MPLKYLALLLLSVALLAGATIWLATMITPMGNASALAALTVCTLGARWLIGRRG